MGVFCCFWVDKSSKIWYYRRVNCYHTLTFPDTFRRSQLMSSHSTAHSSTPAAHGKHEESFGARWWPFLMVMAFIVGGMVLAPQACPIGDGIGGIIAWWFIYRAYLWWSDKKAASAH